MSGITDLQTLLKTMSPEISDSSFVMVSMPSEEIPLGLNAEGTFREKEGITVICEEGEATKHSFAYEAKYKRITLCVHSSLEAVGFLHAISERLSQANISCNVVSAYYHDHLFVLESAADAALKVLDGLSQEN